MIESFGNKLAQDIYDGKNTKNNRGYPKELYEITRRKIFLIYYAHKIADLLASPSNNLEKKKGNLKNFWSIKINKQWRILFKWAEGSAYEVKVVDYHN